MIPIGIIADMGGMMKMNKLTKEKLMTMYSEGKNLTGKPIYIDFYADW